MRLAKLQATNATSKGELSRRKTIETTIKTRLKRVAAVKKAQFKVRMLLGSFMGKSSAHEQK